jgi:hypothetical protein
VCGPHFVFDSPSCGILPVRADANTIRSFISETTGLGFRNNSFWSENAADNPHVIHCPWKFFSFGLMSIIRWKHANRARVVFLSFPMKMPLF